MKYHIKPVKWLVGPEDKPLFSDGVTFVELVDEAAGQFLEISQEESKIRLDFAEWPLLRRAVALAIRHSWEAK
jgi:hypothetical protein